MGLRAWIEESPALKSAALGSSLGAVLFFLPWGLEITIMIAMMMPGIYWGFAFTYDGTTELLQESVNALGLAYVYYGYYLHNLTVTTTGNSSSNPYCAPLYVFVHGMVDWLHYFRVAPLSSSHVTACCEHHPIICGSFDFAFAATMSLLIFVTGR